MAAQTRPVRRPALLARSLLAVLAISGGAAACGVSVGDEVTPVGGDQATSSTDGGSSTTSTVVLSEGSFEGTGGAVFLREAAAATAEVTSQKMTITMTTSGIPEAGDVVMSYEGAFDNAARQGHMVIDMGGSLGAFGEGMGRMEMVIDGDTIYVRSDLFSAVAGDKPWVSMTEEGLGETGGVDVQGDPTQFLEFLEGVGEELEELGREDQRGVSTTHVRTEIDMAKLMADASVEDRAGYEQSLEGLGGAAGAFESIPVDVWIDDDGYVRRLTMTFATDLEPGGAGGGASDLVMSMDIELYGFNEPVEVPIPDPSEVGELEPFTQLGD